MKKILTFLILHATATAMWSQSPYITEVYEYRPAPGQFINTYPAYADGDTEADMCRKVLASIGGTKGDYISLGGFGGYVTFGFDHTIINEAGKADFKVLGNSFFSTTAEKPDGGSSEPGVIMVSRDENGNGKPDDTWYEIRGEAYDRSTAGYSITYARPAADHTPVVSDATGAYSDDEYIHWTANDGTSGYMRQLVLHQQPYYPEWVSENTLTFSGTRLPDNAVQEGSRIKQWVLYPIGNGYADCYPNDDDRAGIDISLATDADGKPANLRGIDFVRVYTGQNQDLAELGETSTEVTGAVDLHPSAGAVEAIGNNDDIRIIYTGGRLRVVGAEAGTVATVYDIAGRAVFSMTAGSTASSAECRLPKGTYVVRCGGHTDKIIVR